MLGISSLIKPKPWPELWICKTVKGQTGDIYDIYWWFFISALQISNVSIMVRIKRVIEMVIRL